MIRMSESDRAACESFALSWRRRLWQKFPNVTPGADNDAAVLRLANDAALLYAFEWKRSPQEWRWPFGELDRACPPQDKFNDGGRNEPWTVLLRRCWTIACSL